MSFQTKPAPDKHRKKNKRPSSVNSLVFILTFAVVLLILVGAAVLILPKWLGDSALPFLPTETTTATTQPTAPSRFSAEDRFSLTMFITDDDNHLQTAVLTLFKPDTTQVDAIAVPAELQLPDGENDTLARRFETGGATSAQLGLLNEIGTPIDYYVVMSYADAEAYLTALGDNLAIRLPKDVHWQSEDGDFSLHSEAGDRALSAKQVANLLRCDNWQGGRRERATMHAEIVGAYIRRFITDERTLATDRNALEAVCDTNLTSEQLLAINLPLSYLAEQNNGKLCTVLPTEGTFEGAGDQLRYIAEEAMWDAVKQAL